jgi:hypothetical protein
MARIEKRAKSCIATISYWPDPSPPGCPPGAVMFVFIGCPGPCEKCDDARRRIWRPELAPLPATQQKRPSFPPEL